MNRLEELIPQYALNKSELDSYKKICDRENAEIKQIMLSDDLDKVEVDGYRAICTVSTRETMNEEMMLEIAHQFDIPDIVKVKEYIDYDALEKAIYDGNISQDVLLEMEKAKEVKEVVTLKVTKIKKKEAK